MTGSLKSTLAALALCHYGSFTGDTLPGSWLSTDNALEKQLFAAKDLLFVVDDFAPERDRGKAAQLEARVNRIVRQIGNHTARGRLRPDLSSAPDRPPRCLVISTGEQLPLGIGSVAARILPVTVDRSLVDLGKLTQAQQQAELYSAAMSAYISWLRPQLPGLRENLTRTFQQMREKLRGDGHLRMPEAVAHLYLGADLGLRFMRDQGILNESQADAMRQEALTVFQVLAEQHARLVVWSN